MLATQGGAAARTSAAATMVSGLRLWRAAHHRVYAVARAYWVGISQQTVPDGGRHSVQMMMSYGHSKRFVIKITCIFLLRLVSIAMAFRTQPLVPGQSL